MDGRQTETKSTREVERSFEGSRLDGQLITAAYAWVLPGTRCRSDVEPTQRTCGETDAQSKASVSTARRQATGA
jgi:hypothetical protein